MTIPNSLTCRQAVKLMLLDEEQDIDAADRLAVQVHVRICYMCARFVGQLNFMRRATKAWRSHSETHLGEPPGS